MLANLTHREICQKEVKNFPHLKLDTLWKHIFKRENKFVTKNYRLLRLEGNNIVAITLNIYAKNRADRYFERNLRENLNLTICKHFWS